MEQPVRAVFARQPSFPGPEREPALRASLAVSRDIRIGSGPDVPARCVFSAGSRRPDKGGSRHKWAN